jgi:threonine dehydrogenase-like Zn-dependent dehydrogenase
MMSDILPTAWFGADLAEIEEGDHVLVFGCGPVGLLAIASAMVMGGNVIAVDRLPDRLAMAAQQGATTINFDEVDVPDAVLKLTDGDGARRVIDAVGIDAQHAHGGPDQPGLLGKAREAIEQAIIEPTARKLPRHWKAGDNPSQALDWAVECVAKGGTIAIIGVYPPTDRVFPIGMAINKNVTVRMGNANHRRYYDVLIEHVLSGRLDPQKILTQTEPMTRAIDAFKAFDEREPGWIKVELDPAS